MELSGARNTDSRRPDLAIGRGAEMLLQYLAELEPCAQEARLYRRFRDAEEFGSLFDGELFHVAQLKDNAESDVQFGDGCGEEPSELFLSETLFGRRAPVFNLARHQTLFRFHRIIERDFTPPALAELHERLIHRDAHQPCVEARIAAEVGDMLESLKESVLTNVLRVLVVLRDVPCEAIDSALIAIHQGFKS